MADWPHLARAPITEALIDLRVKLSEGLGIEAIAPFRDRLSQRFPKCRERKKFSGQLVFSQAGQPTVCGTSGGPDGFLLTSADGIDVVQGRLDGFTFSRLKPYRDWTHIRDSARSCWEVYRDCLQPAMVTRIAVRYINRLDLPLPLGDFRDWLRTVPEVSPALPQGLAGFFLKLQIPFTEPKGMVNLIQVLEVGDYQERLPLIFDIDAFVPEQVDPGDEAIWKRLEDLREIKNQIFFGSITASTLELYK